MTDLTVSKYVGGDGERRQLIWDYTSLSMAACLRKYKLSVVDGWRWKTEAAAPSFGIAAHETYEVYDRTLKDVGGDIDAALDAAIRFALTKHAKLAESASSEFTLKSLIRGLIWYSEQFAEDILISAVDDADELEMERRFQVPLPMEGNFFLSGRIDKLVERAGELIILDRKFTKSTLTGYYFSRYKPDLQQWLYVWALRQFGFDVSSYMIEAHQVAATMYRCERLQFEVPLDRMHEAVEYAVSRAREVEIAHETGVWPMNMTECHTYGGCMFRENVCSVSQREAERLLPLVYEKWEPKGTEETNV